MTRQKKKTPTQKIKIWIKDFLTKRNPVFGDLPPCPFARKAMMDKKVEFIELPGTADWRTIYQLIWNADFWSCFRNDGCMYVPGAECLKPK